MFVIILFVPLLIQQIVFFLVLRLVTWLHITHVPLHHIILKFAHKPPRVVSHSKNKKKVSNSNNECVSAAFEMDLVSCCVISGICVHFRTPKTCCNYRAINEQFVCHRYYSEIIKFQWWRMKHSSSGNQMRMVDFQPSMRFVFVPPTPTPPAISSLIRARSWGCKTMTTACCIMIILLSCELYELCEYVAYKCVCYW